MSRLRILYALLVFAFLAVWARLFYWQILRSDVLAADALSQYTTEYSIYPQRGDILTAEGEYLVTNQPAYLLYAEPQKIDIEDNLPETISEILQIEEASISAKLDFKRDWVPLLHYVPEDKKAEIEKLELKGVGFEKEARRFYPEGSASAQLVGFVGKNAGGEPVGYFGIEGYYDEILRGKPGFLRQEKDAFGLPIPIGNRNRIEPIDGADLKLNIDRGVQRIVEKNLEKGIERYAAKAGQVIVLDPKSGAVIALAATPGYDPREYTDYDTVLYKNPAVSSSYEPGSTFKILTMAAAIEEGAVEVTTTYDEKGPIEVQDYTIRTWNNEYGGETDMTQILERSSNVGMVFVGQRLGVEKFYDYLKNYGFGQETGIDLQEETAPPLRGRSNWKEIDLATASFGQGIAVTPIQLIRAASALANGGLLITPRVADEIVMSADEKIKVEAPPPERVLSRATAAILSEMMVSAVENGDARWAKPQGFRIAGKTGTAQIPIAGHYDPEKTIASFIGFAPADNPRFIMLTILNEPESSPWGSETAAPLFFDISRDIFAHMNISPG